MPFPIFTPEGLDELRTEVSYYSDRIPILSLYARIDPGRDSSLMADVKRALLNAHQQIKTRFPHIANQCSDYLSRVLTPYIADTLFENDMTNSDTRGVALFAPVHKKFIPSGKEQLDITGFTLPKPHIQLTDEPITIRTRAEVDTTPFLQPLLLLLDQEEPVIVGACWEKGSRIYQVFLGRCTHVGSYSTSRLRAVRHIVQAIDHERRRSGAQRIVLVGDAQMLHEVRRAMPEEIRSYVIGVRELPESIKDFEMAKRIAPLLRSAEHKEEQQRIQKLIHAKASPGSAATGLADSLHMITKHRANMVILQQGYESEGSICDNCEALLASSRTCRYCGFLVRSVDDIVTRAVEKAARDGSIIEFVSPTADIAALGYIGTIAHTNNKPS